MTKATPSRPEVTAVLSEATAGLEVTEVTSSDLGYTSEITPPMVGDSRSEAVAVLVQDSRFISGSLAVASLYALHGKSSHLTVVSALMVYGGGLWSHSWLNLWPVPSMHGES